MIDGSTDYAREYYATSSASRSQGDGAPASGGGARPLDAPLSTVVCALKAYVTWAGVEIVSEARERCGGMVRGSQRMLLSPVCARGGSVEWGSGGLWGAFGWGSASVYYVGDTLWRNMLGSSV